MKILLFVPPASALTVTPPLGLGYIAAVLRKNGYDAAIFDAQKESLDIKKSVKKIEKINPDVLGISVLSSNYGNTKKIIEGLKERLSGIKIVVGGAHASALPYATLKETKADFLIRGEGERPFLALINFLEKKEGAPSVIENLCYRENGEIKTKPITAKIENLNEIPFPAWDLIAPREYPPNPHQFFFKRYPIAPVITTRGCPYLCTFCSASFLAGNKLRLRSPENVVDEIELLVGKYGVKEVHFEDDNFTLFKKHVEAVCLEIINRGIEIVWQCPNGIRIDTIDENIVHLMKKSGCYRLAFGIESGSQEILDRANKKLNLKNVPEVMKMVKGAGIESHGFFIFGLPGETEKTAMETIEFIEKLPLDFLDASLLTYLPGSRLFSEKYSDDKMYSSIQWDDFNYFTAEPTEALSRESLKRLQKLAMRKFYFNPKTMFYLLRRIKLKQIPHVFRIVSKYIL